MKKNQYPHLEGYTDYTKRGKLAAMKTFELYADDYETPFRTCGNIDSAYSHAFSQAYHSDEVDKCVLKVVENGKVIETRVLWDINVAEWVIGVDDSEIVKTGIHDYQEALEYIKDNLNKEEHSSIDIEARDEQGETMYFIRVFEE